MALENQYINKLVTAKDSVVIIRKSPSFTGSKITSFKSGEIIGRSSGAVINQPDGKWIQINLSNTIGDFKYGYAVEYYRGKKNITFSPPGDSPVAELNGQKLVDSIIENDKKTYSMMLNIYGKIVELKKKNISIPSDLVRKLSDSYVSLSNRQEKLKKLEDVKITTWKPKNTNQAQNLASFVETRGGGGMLGIGFVWLLVIVLAIVIGAGSAVIIYYATKPDYEDSKRDLKVTEELKKALDKLSPDDQQTVKDEFKKQANEAYNAGKQNQSFADFFGGWTGKIILGVGGFLLIDGFSTKRKKK